MDEIQQNSSARTLSRAWELTDLITGVAAGTAEKVEALDSLKSLGSSAIDSCASTLIRLTAQRYVDLEIRRAMIHTLRHASPWVAVEGMTKIRKTFVSRSDRQMVDEALALLRPSIGARFLDAMTDPGNKQSDRYNVVSTFREIRVIGRREKQHIIAPLVPALVAFAEEASKDGHPEAYSIRNTVFDAIRLAPREVAVEGMIRVKEATPTKEQRWEMQMYITEVRRSLNATKRTNLSNTIAVA